MKLFALLALVALAVTCGPDPNAQLPGFVHGAGGQSSMGGANDTGGTSDNGGAVGAGGAVGNGGNVGNGGKVGTGGKIGSGGAAGGTVHADAAAGGASAGGSTGAGSGGSGGGNDASTAPKDTALPRPDASPTCMSQVVTNGYACGAVTSCADCVDINKNSREAACKAGIDCLAAAGASCGASCQQDCYNKAGDTPGIACVKALQSAACGGEGCGNTPPGERG